MTAQSIPPAATTVPRWDEEPEIIKFIRCDAVQYEGDWAPEAYDPACARATFESMIEDTKEAEALGYDGLVTTEHHFDGWTMVPSPNVYLAAIARETERIRLGHSVQVLSVHNPWRLAEEAGMVDILSNGRAEIGVGKGNFSVERQRYTPDESELDARYAEGIELLLRALRETSLTFEGRFHRISAPSTVYPKPFNPGMRLWMPAMRPEVGEWIGSLGQNLFSFLAPEARPIFERYRAAAAAHGHAAGGENFIGITSVIVAPTDAEAERSRAHSEKTARETLTARGLPKEEADIFLPAFAGVVVGTPQTVREQLREALQASGARRACIVFRMRGLPEDVARQSQRMFATEVMPQLRDLPV
ncbi:MAG: LLM class flavin-dependent oxidoreductase [Gammaproteobacteria bacterium]|nr:LLM class flavin-dependent oxidoreductase [Gammaproteobacteria bacterium]